MECLLGRKPGEFYMCTEGACSVCGWEAREANRRERLRSRYGLTLGSDGLRRLVISQGGSPPSGETGGEDREADPLEVEARPARGIRRVCPSCQREFMASRGNQRYCCSSCRVLDYNRRSAKKNGGGVDRREAPEDAGT